MRRAWIALLLAAVCVYAGTASAKSPKAPRKPDPMLQARTVCDSLAGVARGREGVTVSMREDRVPRGWAFQEDCFEAGPPGRRAAFTRGLLGCSFDTSPLEREKPVAEGQYAPGYLLTLGVVVLDSPPR